VGKAVTQPEEIVLTNRSAIRSALSFVAALLLSASADAQLFRTYLASDGNDANPCTLALPCRLLPAALAAVMDGGGIWMLDSANYNTAPVNITKSVSILAVPGAVGSVVATGGGPAISIATPGLKVSLRNLVIAPLPGGGGTEGVNMSVGGVLTIEQSLIADLYSHGVWVLGTGNVRITDTIIRSNVGYAVFLKDGATGTISRTQIIGNASGVHAYSANAGTTTARVTDSVITSGQEGVFARSDDPTGLARIFVTRSTIVGTDKALSSFTLGASSGAAQISVSYSMITNNNNGWYLSGTGTVVRSLGNNHLIDNTGSSGPLTTLPLQ